MSRKKEIEISRKMVLKDGQFFYEVHQWTLVYDDWDKARKTNHRVVYRNVAETDGLTKSMTLQIVIQKPLLNTTEPNQFVLFLAKYTITIPEEARYRHCWLKKVESRVIVNVLGKISYPLSLKEDNIAIVEKIGKDKRIGPKRAKELLDAKKAYLVRQRGRTFQFCAYESRL